MGFCLGTTVDGGETVVKRAARVSHRYAGQGIYKMLTDQVQREFTAPMQSFITSDDNPAIYKDSFLRTYTEILHRVR